MVTTEGVSDEAARAAAREILAADAFTRWTTDYESWLRLLDRLAELMPDWVLTSLAWLQEALESAFEFLGWILGLFGFFGEVSGAFGWLAVSVLAAALIVLVWQWRLRRDRRIGSPVAARHPGRLHAEALRDARTLAIAGRYLEAAHRVQLATLALLIEFDWLELARSDPNRTLRDRVTESRLPGREKRELVELVDRLEKLWFDEPEDDPTLFEDWLSLDARIASIAIGGRS